MVNRTVIETLSKECETPCYLFDVRSIEHRVHELRMSLPSTVKLCYAMKANPFILQPVSELVPFVEVCSPGEYDICRMVGIPDEMLVISGVYKSPSLMQRLVSGHAGIRRYTVESVSQLELLESLACDRGRRVPVLFRLTSGNQFGMDVTEIKRIAGRLGEYPSIDFRGIQLFSGTQKSSTKRIKREIAMLDELLGECAEASGVDDLELEYGPGLPVEYCEGSSNEKGPALVEVLAESLRNMSFKGAVTLEIGRYIAAPCGTYITSVVDVKCNCGQNYAIVDGGKHQITYYDPSLALKSPSCYVLGCSSSAASGVWTVCGSLCTSGDTIVKQASFGDLDVGDRIVFPNAGAYCMTEGMSLFLSRDLPRVYLHYGLRRIHLVRPSVETSDLNTPLNIF